CTCDLKSMSYFSSALPLIADSRYSSGRHIKVLSTVKPGQDSGEYDNTYGGASYTLPHVPEMEEQFFAALMTDELCTSGAKKYKSEIRQIVSDLLLDGGDSGAGKCWNSKPERAPKEKKAKEKAPGAIRPLRKGRAEAEQDGSLLDRLRKGGKS
ncbi:hypothetical protein LJC63_09820, partial [Ruminococcaceae bacterium OttesenSCG-928-L11]|nr:hypothetical protein [Ruminococcaceae bacterium OttesenSCG-928-L11]